jgi:hypothetical protein
MDLSLRGQFALGLLAGCMALAPAGHAASVPPLAGGLLGEIRNNAGIAQMGATVILYDRYDHLVRQALSNEGGKFVFESLAPGAYSIRVVLASFAPALRRNILVAAGSESILRIHLATVLSTLELAPASESQGALMNDDWKWVLRTSHSTRPVLRYLPDSSSSSSTHHSMASAFSETTGMLRVSGGDGNSTTGSTAQDMGTAFALSTLINGSSHVRLSGNLGYMANSGLPAAGFRTTYSHDRDGLKGPQISFTTHQVYFPGLGASANPEAGPDSAQQTGPVLRTVSIGAMDTLQVNDALKLEYGAHMESVAFLNRVSYMSPFGRASYDLGSAGTVRFAFSSGTEPAELIGRSEDGQSPDISAADLNVSGLNQDLAALALLPRVSRSGGRMHLQRSQNWEAGYVVVEHSRRYSASVYMENVADAAYTLSPFASFLSRDDLLPDLNSSNYLFDIGGYHRTGFSGTVTQAVGDKIDLTLSAGRGGALVASPGPEVAQTGEDVRAQIHKAPRAWVTARASATIPGSGTRVATSYGWTDFRSLMPVHLSLTGATTQDEGWNMVIHQPLPRFSSLRGRLEATVELRNALAQGYLPIRAQGDHPLILTNSPRALRGGLNFLF